MNHAGPATRFRVCRLLQSEREIEAWAPDHLVTLGSLVKIVGLQDEWLVTSMTTDVLDESVLRDKHEWNPKLYPIVEIEPDG